MKKKGFTPLESSTPRKGDKVKSFLTGFTLTEMIVGVFIFLILASVMFVILATGRNAWQIGDVRIQLQQELRKGREAMLEDLRQAGISTIVGVPADGNTYNTITFRMPYSVVNGVIVWGEQIQFLLGGLNNRQLLRRRLTVNEDRILANDITSLEIIRQSETPKILDITLKADKTTYSGTRIESDLNFQVKLRN